MFLCACVTHSEEGELKDVHDSNTVYVMNEINLKVLVNIQMNF